LHKLIWVLAVIVLGSLGWRQAAAQAPAASTQSTEPRIAFVAGYAAYAKGPLKSPLNDASLVSEALRSIGFDVFEAAELNQADFQRGYRDYLARLESAGKDAIGFVYLSGYGLSLEGENYLLPSDGKIERESEVLANAIKISDLLRPLAAAPLRARIMVVDASRPLTFRLPGRPIAPGLDAIQAPMGTLIGMASGPGTVAEDGPETYGVYAVAIAEMLREGGRDLDGVFTRVRARAHQVTQGRRTPWHAAAISDSLILVPADAAASQQPRAQRGSRPMRDVGPDEAYALAIELDSIEGYAEFLEAYPRHPYGRRLFQLIRSRRESMAWLRANQINTPLAYWTYLQRYQRGLYGFDATRKLRTLGLTSTPPADFKPIEFDDVPPPLPGEPEDYIGGYDDAPPPPALLIAAAPTLFQNLPAPRARRGALPATVSFPVNPKFAAGKRIAIAATSVPAETQRTPPTPAPEQSAAAPSDTPAVNPPPSAAPPSSATPSKNDRRMPQKPEPRQPRTPPQTLGSRPAPSAPAQRQPGAAQSCDIIDGVRYCRW
jgi:uncharacterized caspase-like protein